MDGSQCVARRLTVSGDVEQLKSKSRRKVARSLSVDQFS